MKAVGQLYLNAAMKSVCEEQAGFMANKTVCRMGIGRPLNNLEPATTWATDQLILNTPDDDIQKHCDGRHQRPLIAIAGRNTASCCGRLKNLQVLGQIFAGLNTKN